MTTENQLLPCPFCGGRSEFNEHDDECYFTSLAKAKASPKGDVSWAIDLIPAWNRRAALTQPAQAAEGEEVVVWLMQAIGTNQFEFARPHQKAIHKTIWTDAFPVYRTAPPTSQEQAQQPSLGALAKRRIFDAIRSAYDLGYNDARNARTVPGDSAPGYDGRSVEEDHGSALFNILSKRLKPATPEPVGEAVASIYITPGGDREFDDWKHDLPVGRNILYTRPAPGVPEGWAIDLRPDLSPTALVIRSPEDGPGFMTVENNHANIAYRMLYRLASDLLAAAQAKGVADA